MLTRNQEFVADPKKIEAQNKARADRAAAAEAKRKGAQPSPALKPEVKTKKTPASKQGPSGGS